MIIWIDDDIFSGKIARIDCLALMRLTAMRRHTVLISADPQHCPRKLTEQIAPHFCEWRMALPPALAAELAILLEKVALASANAVVRAIGQRILVSERKWTLPHSYCQIDVATALHALAQPLFILVENQINDAAFLRAAMPPDWRKKLQQWELGGQLRFSQGGGITEIRKFVGRFGKDEYATLAYGYPAQMWWYLHFVIYDHDGASADAPDTIASDISQMLKVANKVQHGHRLWRRSQEHYMPLQAMLALLEAYASKWPVLAQDYQKTKTEIDNFYEKNEAERFFSNKIPAISAQYLKKNYFSYMDEYNVKIEDAWFEEDGSGPEMRHLAEAIAALM